MTRHTWRKSSYSGHNGECVEVAATAWRKSTFSGHNGDCVEVAQAPDLVAVRDSKDPSGPVLTFVAAEWREFLSGLRTGEFDL
jgi:predicted secreted Zn-dependent protease